MTILDLIPSILAAAAGPTGAVVVVTLAALAVVALALSKLPGGRR